MGNKNKGKVVEPIKSTSYEKKTFDYRVGEVTLNFTLRTDIKDELVVFAQMLAQAHVDVTKEIAKD